MEIRDCGSSVLFDVGCIRLAELQFTPDFGRVLIINPRCMVYANPKYYSGVEGIKPEYRRCFDDITKRWQIDRYTVRRR